MERVWGEFEMGTLRAGWEQDRGRRNREATGRREGFKRSTIIHKNENTSLLTLYWHSARKLKNVLIKNERQRRRKLKKSWPDVIAHRLMGSHVAWQRSPCLLHNTETRRKLNINYVNVSRGSQSSWCSLVRKRTEDTTAVWSKLVAVGVGAGDGWREGSPDLQWVLPWVSGFQRNAGLQS